MAFDVPDYSYGAADSALCIIDHLLRVGTDSEDGSALAHLEQARYELLAYKDLIFDQVMST